MNRHQHHETVIQFWRKKTNCHPVVITLDALEAWRKHSIIVRYILKLFKTSHWLRGTLGRKCCEMLCPTVMSGPRHLILLMLVSSQGWGPSCCGIRSQWEASLVSSDQSEARVISHRTSDTGHYKYLQIVATNRDRKILNFTRALDLETCSEQYPAKARRGKIIENLSREQTKLLCSSVDATNSMILRLRRLQSVSDNWEFGVREVIITRVFVICIDISVIYEAPVGIVLFTRNHSPVRTQPANQ